jgi:hypothetical protein
MTDPLLTAAARRYVARMTSAIAPHADRLDRRFRTVLRRRGHDAAQARAFLAITPAAASRLPSLNQFLEQVEYNGRRLAKLNVQPGEAKETLKAFGPLLDAALAGRFEPAREQLHLATVLALHDAFYQVREAEAQAFFGLYRAESDASASSAFSPARFAPAPAVCCCWIAPRAANWRSPYISRAASRRKS